MYVFDCADITVTLRADGHPDQWITARTLTPSLPDQILACAIFRLLQVKA